MPEFKSVYDFTVSEKIEKDVESVSTKGGKEVKTITKETVESPIRVFFKRPTRRQEEDADLFYSVEMSKFIKEGLLTRAMLQNKYKDTGGLLSEKTREEMSAAYKKLLDTQDEYQRLQSIKKPTKKQKEKIDSLKSDIAAIQRDLVEIETSHNSLFDNTADGKAQTSLLRWYALNFIYIQREDDEEPVPYFIGETYKDKLEDYYAKEEEGSEIYSQIGSKIGTVIAIWSYQKGLDKESIDETIKRLTDAE